MTHILDFCFQGLPIRVVTQSLVAHLMLNMPLTPAAVVDFGVDTENHYRALQTMVRNAYGDGADGEDDQTSGFTLLKLHRVIVELDKALGNSARLNALVKTYVPEYANLKSVRLETRSLLLVCTARTGLKNSWFLSDFTLVHFYTSWDLLLGRSDKVSA